MSLLLQLSATGAFAIIGMVVLDGYVSTQAAMIAAMRFHRAEWLLAVRAAYRRDLVVKRIGAGLITLGILVLGQATTGPLRVIAGFGGIFGFLVVLLVWNAWPVWTASDERNAIGPGKAGVP